MVLGKRYIIWKVDKVVDQRFVSTLISLLKKLKTAKILYTKTIEYRMKIFSIIELFKVQMYQIFMKIKIECLVMFVLKLHSTTIWNHVYRKHRKNLLFLLLLFMFSIKERIILSLKMYKFVL